MARWDLHHDPCDAAVDGELDVADHTTAKGVDLAVKSGRGDSADRVLVGRGYRREPRFDAMDAGLRQGLGDPQLLVGIELDPGLLFSVPQGDVMYFYLGWEIERSGDLRQV